MTLSARNPPLSSRNTGYSVKQTNLNTSHHGKIQIRSESEENWRRREEEAAAEPTTFSDLKNDEVLWYKTIFLLYDLCNIAKDQASEQRTLRTKEELYISEPYFTTSEAARIKATTVEIAKDSAFFDPVELEEEDAETTTTSIDVPESVSTTTIEEAIKTRLAGFLDKRKASGDSRPCGPHDLGPI